MEQKIDSSKKYISLIEERVKRRPNDINNYVLDEDDYRNDRLELLNQLKDTAKRFEELEKLEIIKEENNKNSVLKHENKDILKYGDKYIEAIKEDENMKRLYMKKIHMKQVKFLLLSFSLIIFALINLLIFSSGNVFLNPYVSIFILIMGIGWGATGIASIFEK